jgi:AraC-like DNA-binding protein
VINGFRVEAVKTALTERRGELLAIAHEAGFSSKASFNRVFREHTGVSPSAWRTAHVAEIAANPASETTAGTQPA